MIRLFSSRILKKQGNEIGIQLILLRDLKLILQDTVVKFRRNQKVKLSRD